MLNNTSIVIPLGTGSRWNDLELKFCLRSITKHLSGYGDVFIIGEKPSWLQNVIHIPATDSDQSYDKERNIFNKIMIACNDDRVTDDFLFMNDDHFLLQDFEAGEFPEYYDGFLNDFKIITDYKNSVWNTQLFFLAMNPRYTDIHCPILYNKQEFKENLGRLDWSVKFGYCIKTVYSSLALTATQFEYCPDLKLKDPLPYEKIIELIACRPWFSIGDAARQGDLLQVLQDLYSLPSKYEKT